jgi:hypothetical protein
MDEGKLLMKKIIIPVVLLSIFSSTAYASEAPHVEKEETCTPITKTVYVDVPGPTVYVNVPGPTVTVIKTVTLTGPTVYVDKPVVETQTVTVPGPATTVNVENPVNTDLQKQIDALKIKYAKLLKSYTISHNAEVREAAKRKHK